jgi:hypothetical protein
MPQSHEENWPTATNPRYLLKLTRVRPSGRQYLLLACAVVRNLWPQALGVVDAHVLAAVERFGFAQPRKGVQTHVWRDVVEPALAEIIPAQLSRQRSAAWLRALEMRLGPISQVSAADINVLFSAVFPLAERQACRDADKEVEALLKEPARNPKSDDGARLSFAEVKAEVLARTAPQRRAEMDAALGMPVNPSAIAAGYALHNELVTQRTEQRDARACDLIREVFGNPFRPAVVRPDWLACNHGAARHIAEKIAATADFTDLPVLADALEDAGCCEHELLGHLREAKSHVPGCWALDAVLGK